MAANNPADAGFPFPDGGDGWYEDRAGIGNVDGSQDSPWVPTWDQGEDALQGTYDPRLSVGGTLSQGDLAKAASYAVQAESEQVLYGAGPAEFTGSNAQQFDDRPVVAADYSDESRSSNPGFYGQPN